MPIVRFPHTTRIRSIGTKGNITKHVVTVLLVNKLCVNKTLNVDYYIFVAFISCQKGRNIHMYNM